MREARGREKFYQFKIRGIDRCPVSKRLRSQERYSYCGVKPSNKNPRIKEDES
nr:MAG TPA: hypothetical protein [Caudoviricetes sp.]